MKTLQLQKRVACLAMAIGTTLACSTAMAVEPRNSDRNVLPVISGSKIRLRTGSEWSSCTVGAVLVPTSIWQRLTPYQNATRWLVIAKHCGPMYATVYSGDQALGAVEWQSAGSDIALVRVSPIANPTYTWCQAHHSGASYCNPYAAYTPRARNQVFMLRGGRERRLPVAGYSNAPDGQFCTSGFVTGVRCVWRGMSLEPGMLRPSYANISAAHADELYSLDGGDSGGPALTYDLNLIGIISSSNTANSSILFYTSMADVLQELNNSYMAAPNSLPVGAGKGNPLAPFGENAGWQLAPADEANDDAGAAQTQPIGG
ncbi:hypothetical protein [Xanthomonas albilineans]|uniref:Hypothetical secreted signal peptide protein n=1 Tax=Xanthomonas albilineans (strain GPE PC73 / CFBP 7063) TaxID=380358 RepID=D2U9Q8_XANAP|nr:hypothetical protein [Xanthomonas albilineans]QHQ29250.1 putative secreted signal peptide protein [Xanthomonas albilineans]CBA17010.1 hypothetical secreted signal peptide protein [Xanthomonas albilineans GPE PC73]